MSRRLHGIIAALAVVFACFAFLGSRGLNEPDEGRYAEIAREMVATGDWLVPHLNGFPHFQKPPLLYWFTAASLAMFGSSEWAVRLPSALAALGTLGLTFWMTRTLLGRTAAWCAALALFSSVGFFVLARLLTPDMLMTFWITAALACLVRVSRGGSAPWAWAFFAAMGFGFLTKGPMALVVPISGALGLRWAMARQGSKLALPWAAGLALALAIGLSWFVALALSSHELFHYFWHDELLNRFASRAHGRSQPFWFFVPVIAAGLLPWAWFLPGLVRDGWRRLGSERPLSPLHGLMLGWLVPPFVVLSLSGSKLSTYVLPLLPALALLLAWWWKRNGFPLRRVAACSGIAVATWLALCSQLDRFNDLLGAQASIRPLVETLRRQPDLHTATIFACGVRVHSLEYYLGAPVTVTRGEADVVLPPMSAQNSRLMDSATACEEAMSRLPVAYGVLREKDAAKYFPPDRWRSLARVGRYLLVAREPVPEMVTQVVR
ncbi:MAG: glycosyltransferase family 39 protein [Chthoniobacteraceae bacterium]